MIAIISLIGLLITRHRRCLKLTFSLCSGRVLAQNINKITYFSISFMVSPRVPGKKTTKRLLKMALSSVRNSVDFFCNQKSFVGVPWAQSTSRARHPWAPWSPIGNTLGPNQQKYLNWLCLQWFTPLIFMGFENSESMTPIWEYVTCQRKNLLKLWKIGILYMLSFLDN